MVWDGNHWALTSSAALPQCTMFLCLSCLLDCTHIAMATKSVATNFSYSFRESLSLNSSQDEYPECTFKIASPQVTSPTTSLPKPSLSCSVDFSTAESGFSENEPGCSRKFRSLIKDAGTSHNGSSELWGPQLRKIAQGNHRSMHRMAHKPGRSIPKQKQQTSAPGWCQKRPG